MNHFSINPRHYFNTLVYIALILIINICFSYLPGFKFSHGNFVSIADLLIGFIYIARDFSQREIGHYVLLAMGIGSILSYLLASPVIAQASVLAFIIAEAVDWGIFTLTKWPLSKRILWSASLSAPVDTFVFLKVAHLLNPVEFSMMILAKWLGVLLLWILWRYRNQKLISSNSALPARATN
jgi:uncharacterized PurR-regulated membrane protein YhhQ (DUF165 family)